VVTTHPRNDFFSSTATTPIILKLFKILLKTSFILIYRASVVDGNKLK